MIRRILILSAFFFSSLAQAELVFDSKLLEVTSDPGAETITAEFTFEVKGEETKILGYESMCSCLAARVEPTNEDGSAKLSWQPGEKGRILAKFELGNFKGTVDKAIVLKTDRAEKAHELVLRVTIPALLNISPATHKWTIGETTEERTFEIKVVGDQPVQILELAGTNPKFPLQLETVKEGFHYRVRVKPTSTDAAAFGMVRLKTDSKIPKYQNEQMFVVVKKAK
ncbi:MAG: DUF1573 domain-containing protein [Verrucomicrobiales bacterium]